MTALEIRGAGDAAGREAAFALRRAVFVDEQGVPLAAEIDEHDAAGAAATRHLLAVEDGEPVGTLRWRVLAPGVGKIERVAVRRDRRGRGIGLALIGRALEELRAAGLGEAVLNAQAGAKAFYERLGFVAEGVPFDEEGIPHLRMRRPLA